jgi:hypothetical protein
MKLHADNRTVFELDHGMLGRQVAYFERAEDAADYVRLNNSREEALQNLRLLDEARARITELEAEAKAGSILKVLTTQEGKPFVVYLSDGMKISIQREGRQGWFRIERTPIVSEAQQGKVLNDDLQLRSQELFNDDVYQRCSKCGRKTWTRRQFNDACGMTQPDGSKCMGWFR